MTTSNGGTVPSGTYRAKVGEQDYEIRVESGQVYLNGTPVAVSFELVSSGHYSLIIDGRSLGITVSRSTTGSVRVTVEGREVEVAVQDEMDLLLERFGVGKAGIAAHREVRAPMPGLVLAVQVLEGQTVQAGEGLLVLEAMKMENELRAPADGAVRTVHVKPGDPVSKGQLLVEFE
jgi:biotin carboxyl carrier protein